MALKLPYITPAGTVIPLPETSLPPLAAEGFYTLAQDLHHEDGYARVEHITGDKDGIEFVLACYPEKPQAKPAKPAWSTRFFFLPDGDLRWDAQAYLYLKTIPAYADAQDC